MPAKPLSADQLEDAQRLKKLFRAWQAARSARGEPFSQDWSSGELKFGQSAMNQYLNGKIPLNADAAIKFAGLIGAEVGDFSPTLAKEMSAMADRLGAATRQEQQEHTVKAPSAARAPREAPDEIRINQFNTGGKMGHGVVLQDQPGVIRSWVVSPEWVQKNVHRITSPKNLAIVTGFGDSMRPLYNPGDPLLVDTGVTVPDIDGVYFFRVGDQGYVKRLQRIPTIDGTVLRAKSDNPQYDPFEIVRGMDFEVFGRVVKAWRGEDF